MPIYSFTIFLSSILSFSLQLLVGKAILPWFGGSATVWSTLLFFFISYLLLGYLYVFYLSKLRPNKQKRLHKILIIFIAFYFLVAQYFFHRLLPDTPNFLLKLSSTPTFQIILLCLLTVGAPYFLLSTTSTLLQSWFSFSNPKKSPYFLYTLSNIGSLLGLLSYPFLIEPNLTLKQQQLFWSLGFALFVTLFYKIANQKFLTKIKKTTNLIAPHLSALATWTALSTISNISLLSTTSFITQSVTPSPFLWLAPLSLFLLSFILAFSGKWYKRSLHTGLLICSLFFTFCTLNNYFAFSNYWINTILIVLTQFLINFVCHSELYKLRPTAKSLTYFYLAISAGGVVGSIFCALLAPSFFKDYWEFPVGLILATLLFMFLNLYNKQSTQLRFQYLLFASILIFLSLKYFANPNLSIQNNYNELLFSGRNFYGTVKVTKSLPTTTNTNTYPYTKILFNGNINHGLQEFNSQNSFTPTTYYTPDSGIGQYITTHPNRKSGKPLRIGVIGLGTGSLAGYCLSGDYFRFYEINPMVIDTSAKQFTFIPHCKAMGGQVDIVEGDARLSIQKEQGSNPQNLDVLVVDAFTDDAIPTHLITAEAINLFQKHLNSNGVLAYHITNRHLQLNKVLDSYAAKNKLFAFLHDTPSASWYFLSKYQNLVFSAQLLDPAGPAISIWTDDYSNLLQALK